MAVATITSKGQATIPLIVRKSLGLHPGDQIEFAEQPDGSWKLLTLDLTVDDIAAVVATAHEAMPVESEDKAMIAAATGSFR